MSNYTQSTNFATKDALSPGDPLKIVRGTEINTEFTNIAVAVATKFDTTALASPGPIGATTPAAINGTTINGTTGTFSGNVQMASANGGQLAGLRNKIINGSFTVNQRVITTTTPTTGQYTVDQWQAVQSVAGKYSISTGAANATAVAAGASGNTLTATTLAAYTPLASEVFCILHKIEGLNIADLAWGTASAKTVTLSFYATSSLTGTFGGTIRNSANTRSYPFTYSIPVASTPTRISVTIPGDTTGAFADWLTTTSIGMSVLFSYGTGPTASGPAGAWAAAGYTGATGANSLVSNAGATLTLFNVQLEVGPVATPFEQRPIGMELALCQRYCFVGRLFVPTAPSTQNVPLPVPMRTTMASASITGTGAGFALADVTSNSVIIATQTGGSGQTLTVSTEL